MPLVHAYVCVYVCVCVYHWWVVRHYVVLPEGFTLAQVVSKSEKPVTQMLMKSNWWLCGSSILVAIMMRKNRQTITSAALKQNALGGIKNLVLPEMSSQQRTVKHCSMLANISHLPSYTIMMGSSQYKDCNHAKCSSSMYMTN